VLLTLKGEDAQLFWGVRSNCSAHFVLHSLFFSFSELHVVIPAATSVDPTERFQTQLPQFIKVLSSFALSEVNIEQQSVICDYRLV